MTEVIVLTTSDKRPLIGISPTRYVRNMDLPGPSLLGMSVSDDYVHGVESAGGIPISIPFYQDMSTVRRLAENLDGLLLSGGEDINPLLYGEQPHVGLGAIVPERDAIEKELSASMMEQGRPIFAICRGF